MVELELQTLNMTNLAKTVGKYVDIKPKRIRAELKEYILPRLDFLGGIHRRTQRYFVIEEGYVEPEWKDMVSNPLYQYFISNAGKSDARACILGERNIGGKLCGLLYFTDD